MTPKEKADELIDKMLGYGDEYHHCTQYVAKQCALIALDEIIPIVEGYENALSASQQSDELEYWKQIKQEIEKL